ncbi:MAG: hypothetical protein Q8O95_04160 [bacterium]|nr:hypothetical protein [bacterium]
MWGSTALCQAQDRIPDNLFQRAILLKFLGTTDEEIVSGISVNNIEPNSAVLNLESVEGKANLSGEPIWLKIINDQQEMINLDPVNVSENGSYQIITPPLPQSFQGEIILILSQAKDLENALNSRSKTLLMPFFRYLASDIAPETKKTILEITGEPLSFQQDRRELRQIKSDYRRVFSSDAQGEISIHFQGTVFGAGGKEPQFSSHLAREGVEIPSEIRDLQVESGDNGTLKVGLNVQSEKLPTNQLLSLEIRALLPDEEMTTKHFEGFIIAPETSLPNILQILRENTITDPGLLALLATALISIIILLFAHSEGAMRLVQWITMSCAILGMIIQGGKITLRESFSRGLLEVHGQEKHFHKREFQETESITLTKPDENLVISPALSSSWSNINPLVWEFTLRDSRISSSEIAQVIREKISSNDDEKVFLNTVKQVISINDQELQFITRAPDPLFPNKLTRVTFDKLYEKKQLIAPTQLFTVLEKHSDHTRYLRNEDSADLPFLKAVPPYQTEIYYDNTEHLRSLINTRTVDSFDEPSPVLWPYLAQNDYKIIPKVNTESMMLLLNRNQFALKNRSVLKVLKKLLQSPLILQTSYLQYGQLANQFAPPGVVGFNSEIVDEEENPTAELISQALSELGTESITLRLQYYSTERILAKAIEQVLEQNGITIIPVEINLNQEDHIHSNPDLILISYDFVLADIGGFLDTYIDSRSPQNSSYSNAQVDQLILQARSELNSFQRLELLQQIMQIIVVDDPAGIPLLFKRSFVAEKKAPEYSLWDKILQKTILGW